MKMQIGFNWLRIIKSDGRFNTGMTLQFHKKHRISYLHQLSLSRLAPLDILAS